MAMVDILKKVKSALGISGDYLNDTLEVYIDETKAFMKSAGVSEIVVESEKATGAICRGVADLWNYGSGEAKLSEYFIQRVTQLALEETEATHELL